MKMNEIKKINPDSMKQPTKSYSNGILIPLGSAKLMFVTGQLAQDSEGNVVAPNDASEQTKYILSHIVAILTDAEMTLDDVVKVQFFVSNMDDSTDISKIRDEAFINSKPASTMVEVNRFVKPGCCVEIEVIAAKLG